MTKSFTNFLSFLIFLWFDNTFFTYLRRENLCCQNANVNQFQYFRQRFLVMLEFCIKFEGYDFLYSFGHWFSKFFYRINGYRWIKLIIENIHYVIKKIHVIDQNVDVSNAPYLDFILSIGVRDLKLKTFWRR